MDTKMPAPTGKEKPIQQKITSPSQQLRSGRQWELLGWWYKIAAPVEVEPDTSFEVQDRIRRARLASAILLFLFLVLIAFIPLAAASVNPLLLPIILLGLVICVIVIVLNRRGYITAVGVLGAGTVNLIVIMNLVTAPHGILTTNGLLTYDMLVLSELVVVSLLPPISVFFVAFLNCICMCVDIVLQPHGADLAHLLAASAYTVLVRPLVLQIVVAVVTYVWVRSALHAFVRADRAEEIARLQGTIAAQKKELEFGIQQIQQTLVLAANGNFAIRTPLAQENVLWQVANSLNTLLARLQRSSQSEQELQRIRTEVVRLVGIVREAEARHQPLRVGPAGTALDPFLRELSGRYILQSDGGD